MIERLKVGILGAGHIAGVMAKTIQQMNTAECVAVGSRSIQKAESFAEKYGIVKAYGSYEELLADPDIQLVYIATPHSEHFVNMKKCLEYKKPILCEKPFTVNGQQAKEILDQAKEIGIFVAEAMWTRYLPMVTSIKAILSSGILGDIRLVTGNLGYHIEGNDRLINPALAGGALLDVGVYTLNWASMILGTKVTFVESSCQYHQTGVDRQNSITLHYGEDAMAVLNSSMSCNSDRLGCIHGTKGYAVVENINNFESITVYNQSYEKVEYINRPEQITGYEYQVEACRQALNRGEIQCQEMPHEEILRIMELMDTLRTQWGVRYPFE